MSLRLGVLLSGSGTTLQNLLDRIAEGRLAASIATVIANRAEAFGVERARRAGLETSVIPSAGCPAEDHSAAVFRELRRHGVDLVVLAGYLRRLVVPAEYTNRVMNIHPSLLPAFGGPGFYGLRVHQAVLDRGCKISGCTVHFADPNYDEGPIIAQAAVPVEEGDDAARLAARVAIAECELYPRAITWYAEGRLTVEAGRVRVREQ